MCCEYICDLFCEFNNELLHHKMFLLFCDMYFGNNGIYKAYLIFSIYQI